MNLNRDGPWTRGSTPDRILDVATRIFAQRGFEATTMREIADEVGVAVAALYHHYPSKKEILESIVERGYDELHVALAVCSTDDPTDRIRCLIRQIVLTMHDQFHFAIAARFDRPAIMATMRGRYRTLRLVAVNELGAAVRDGQEAGTIRSDLDPKLAARLLAGMWNWMPDWYRPVSSRRAFELAEGFAGIAVVGAVGPAGERGSRMRRISRTATRASPPMAKVRGAASGRSDAAGPGPDEQPVHDVHRLRGRRRLPQILASAAAGFAEKGYNGATVNNLTAWTGLGRGALYRQIGSKAELLQMIAEHYVAELEFAVDGIAGGADDDPADILERWAAAVFHTQAEQFDFARVFFNERRALPADIAQALDARLHAVGEVPLDAIGRLGSLGSDAGHAFIGMVFGAYLWFRPDDDTDALASQACSIFLNGLTAH